MAAMANGAPGWSLGALLAPWSRADLDVHVGAVALDSRRLTEGSLFLALPGGNHHGLQFTAQAVDAGAAAIAWDEAPDSLVDSALRQCRAHGVVLVRVPGLRRRAGEIAARFHGDPSHGVPVTGVTGTDGKTSVSQFIGQALHAGGTPCGIVGTLGYGLAGHLRAGTHTTPDAGELQRELAELRDAGARAVAMEVSSHALDQYRVAGVRFACAVLTNLSRDHLDYHGSMEAYAEAKASLFRTQGLKAAVLNIDDGFGRALYEELGTTVDCLRYSLDPAAEAELTACTVSQHPGGLEIDARINGQGLSLAVPLLGRFNAANILAVAGALVALGWRPADLPGPLGRLTPVPGRMERFSAPGRADIIVDYAHTPAALEAALAAVRAHYPGALWCVFGCGGDRDRGKRPLMGEVAARLADHVVLTDDNPRTENPETILAEIRAGTASSSVEVRRDRRAAIAGALDRAREGDAILVAGKGHEDYQIVGETRLDFSDRETVATLLKGGG